MARKILFAKFESAHWNLDAKEVLAELRQELYDYYCLPIGNISHYKIYDILSLCRAKNDAFSQELEKLQALKLFTSLFA
jgi:hypothetical protein